MRILVFLSGSLIMAIGMVATQLLPKNAAMEFLQGTLTLGGGMIICGLFSLKSHWHGLIGAGVMALLGAGRGIGNLPDLFKMLEGDRQRGAAPLMEAAITAICLVLLLRVLGALRRERTRQLLERTE